MISWDKGMKHGEEGVSEMKEGIQAWHPLLRLYTDSFFCNWFCGFRPSGSKDMGGFVFGHVIFNGEVGEMKELSLYGLSHAPNFKLTNMRILSF